MIGTRHNGQIKDIRFISEAIEKAQKPSSLNAERNGVDIASLSEWENCYKTEWDFIPKTQSKWRRIQPDSHSI